MILTDHPQGGRNDPAVEERIRRLFQDIGHLRGMRLCLQIHYIRNIIGYDGYLREKYGPEKAGELVRIGEEFQEFSRQFAALQEMRGVLAQRAMSEMLCQTCQKPGRCIFSGFSFGSHQTMHASKGLEFDRVYLPDCQEGKIPSAKSVTEAEIEEERRMFYVAMTHTAEMPDILKEPPDPLLLDRRAVIPAQKFLLPTAFACGSMSRKM